VTVSRRVVAAAVAVVVVVLVAIAGTLVLRDRSPARVAAPAGGATPADVPDPVVRPAGAPITVAVSPGRAFSTAVPGVGHLSAPAGAFASAGSVVVQPLTAEAAPGSLVALGGTGVDVTFRGTTLGSPITVTFDDPATKGRLPAKALPVVLHRPAGRAWEVRPAQASRAGAPPRLITGDFSPNLFGWIEMPDWIAGIGDSIADWATQRTDPRPCAGGAPRWSKVGNKTTLVHLCSTTNIDKASKAVRAELRVQSNRRSFQWVSVAPGADYLSVEDEQDWFRTALSKVAERDRNHEVLLPGDGSLTAGYRQPKQSTDKPFDASIDHWSAAFSVGSAILGLDNRDNVQGAFLSVVKCVGELRTFPSVKSAEGFVKCFVEESLSNLANPGKAFDQALNLFGEAGYAKSAEASLRKASTALHFLGRLIKVIGIAGVIQTTFAQLPDAFSQWGRDRPGAFTLELTGSAAPATTFRTVEPWKDGSAASAVKGATGADSSCIPSELAPRRDAYRCFLDGRIGDPCFVNPAHRVPLCAADHHPAVDPVRRPHPRPRRCQQRGTGPDRRVHGAAGQRRPVRPPLGQRPERGAGLSVLGGLVFRRPVRLGRQGVAHRRRHGRRPQPAALPDR
jgi:hypothetical protein